MEIGIWCNGNTTDSGPVIPGSNPGTPTNNSRRFTRIGGCSVLQAILGTHPGKENHRLFPLSE